MGYKDKTKQEYMREYRQKSKSKESAWFTKVYGRMKRDNKYKFKIDDLPFTKQNFINWIETQYEDKFKYLFSEWVSSGYIKDKVPSIDRKDDYKSYFFENMQLLTWEENNLKGRVSEKNKNQMRNMTKKILSKKVFQINLENNNIIATFVSVRGAGRILNIDNSCISKCCRGEIKSYKGYGWKYE